jgi:hypothetical protein
MKFRDFIRPKFGNRKFDLIINRCSPLSLGTGFKSVSILNISIFSISVLGGLLVVIFERESMITVLRFFLSN